MIVHSMRLIEQERTTRYSIAVEKEFAKTCESILSQKEIPLSIKTKFKTLLPIHLENLANLRARLALLLQRRKERRRDECKQQLFQGEF
jgi:hypothetical protein